MWAVKDGYNGEVIAYCSREEDAYALAYTDLDVDDLLYVEEPTLQKHKLNYKEYEIEQSKQSNLN